MITQTYHLEFLTPCFCAGALQNQAELRPAAIRGWLRWWFRALGGSQEDERKLFGHVHGNSAARSQIIVRAGTDQGTGEKDWFKKIPAQGMNRAAYLLGFFCGRTDRLQAGGALSPGSTATVTVVLRCHPHQKLELALRVFFSVGGIGFRATRTGGSFTTREHTLSRDGWESLSSELNSHGFKSALLDQEFQSWSQLIGSAGYLLKHKFRSKNEGLGISAGRNGTSPNALGSAEPRQASIVHFRAVKVDGVLRLALLEAPHSRLLGDRAGTAHGKRGSVLQMAELVT